MCDVYKPVFIESTSAWKNMILRGLKWVNKLNILWSFRQGPPEIGVSIPQCTGLHRLWAGVEDAASPLHHTPGPVCGPQECCRRLPAAATPHQRPVTCTRTQITLCPLHADNLIHSCRPCVSIWSRGWSVTVPAVQHKQIKAFIFLVGRVFADPPESGS